MPRIQRFAFLIIVLFLGSTFAFSQVNHRPIEDFLNSQSFQWQFYDGAHQERWAVIDYAGVMYRSLLNPPLPYSPRDLETTFTGDITERPLPDGKALVSVTVQGKNVFTRGYALPNSTLFGCTKLQAVLGGTPGLAQILFKVDFINDAGMGAPMPELVDASILSFQLVVRAEGLLPDGSRGFLQMTQVVPPVNGKGIPGQDFVPVEHIKIGAIGN